LRVAECCQESVARGVDQINGRAHHRLARLLIQSDAAQLNLLGSQFERKKCNASNGKDPAPKSHRATHRRVHSTITLQGIPKPTVPKTELTNSPGIVGAVNISMASSVDSE